MPNRDYKSVSLKEATVDRLQRMAVRLSAIDERRLTLSEVVDRLIAGYKTTYSVDPGNITINLNVDDDD